MKKQTEFPCTIMRGGTSKGIFLMEKGGIAAAGTYDELVQDNPTFRAMAVGA